MATATLNWSADSYVPKQGATLQWTVVNCSSSDEAIAACGITIGSFFPFDSHMAINVGGIDAVKKDGPTTYIVTARYTYRESASQENNDSKPPLERKPEIYVRWGSSSESTDISYQGKAILNAAGQTLNPSLSAERKSLFVTISRWEPFYNMGLAIAYGDKLNSNAYTLKGLGLVDQYQSRLISIEPESKYLLDETPVKIIYRLEVKIPSITEVSDFRRKYPFDHWYLNQGTEGFYSDSGAIKRGKICYPGSKPREITRDVLLDGVGKPLDTTLKILGSDGTAKDPVANPTVPTGILFIEIDGKWHCMAPKYGTADFSALNL